MPRSTFRFLFIFYGMAILSLPLKMAAQTKVWHFGENAGLDFSQGNPQAIPGPIFTDEGSAVVSHPDGKTLFSTDGVSIYDGNGNTVSSSLKGNSSSTHSAVIVPHPADPCQRFWVFTIGSADTVSFLDGLQLVEVVAKNGQVQVSSPKKLLDQCGEKLAATPDGNGGYWLVAHDYDTSKTSNPNSLKGRNFYAYHITAGSSFATIFPKKSTAGLRHGGVSWFSGNYWNTVGQMKFNSQGNRLALAIYVNKIVEVFRFEKGTGIVRPMLVLDGFQNETGPPLYGVEFSPSSERLFVSTGFANQGETSSIWVFDLRIAVPRDVWNSRQTVAQKPFSNQKRYPFGGMQLGSDGKIYIARRNEFFVSAIQNPDGPDFQFKDTTVALPSACLLSLPTTIKVPDCSFGHDPCALFSIDIKRDTVLCAEDSVAVGLPPQNGFKYEWNTGETTSRIFAKPNRDYRLTATDTRGCKASSSIFIKELPDLEKLPLPADTVFCNSHPKEVWLDWEFVGVDVLWEETHAGRGHEIDGEGEIQLEISTYCDTLVHYFDAKDADCACPLYAATAFTPDGDGLNDFYEIVPGCEVENFQVAIFDRWGERVFFSTDENAHWDGRFRGKEAKLGVYVYIVNYKGEFDETREATGYFTLLR